MAPARLPALAVAVAIAALLAAIAVPAASAQAPRRGELIAPGVAAAGVDLSNTTLQIAEDRLKALLTAKLERDVVVHAPGRTLRLKAADAKLKFDPARTARRALYAGRKLPAGQAIDVGLVLSHARLPVRAFAQQVASQTRVAPRNATVRITVRRILKRRAKAGAQIDATALAAAIDAALDQPRGSRVLRPERTVRVPAEINANDLSRIYGTVVTVDRANFRLRLFKRLKLSKTYPIAVGAAGYDTPSGVYSIANKQVNPAWHVPESAWAGDLAGSVIPGGAPNNPLKARWLGIADGVGIHGTAEAWSIGSRASHGCIRMHVPDVVDLYPRVPVGSKVLIS
jgi:lipoprotein-anchoring transpeptidase ErfK/SrfK